MLGSLATLPELVIGSISGNGFQACLRSETNVLSIGK